jgi:hypothetical protein
MLLRALPHRGQARARGQQPVANAFAKARRELLGQGLRGGLHQHGGASLVAGLYCPDDQYSSTTELTNCTGRVLTEKITLNRCT